MPDVTIDPPHIQIEHWNHLVENLAQAGYDKKKMIDFFGDGQVSLEEFQEKFGSEVATEVNFRTIFVEPSKRCTAKPCKPYIIDAPVERGAAGQAFKKLVPVK